jgi:hypothetical protein
MYRKTLLAVLLPLLGVALFVTPARADPPGSLCGETVPPDECVTIPLTLGKKYHLEFGLDGMPPETAPAVIDAMTLGTASLAASDLKPMPWQETALPAFRLAAIKLGPARPVFAGVVVFETDTPEAALPLIEQAGVSIEAGLARLGDGLADPDHAAFYDALALEEFAGARQALRAAAKLGA